MGESGLDEAARTKPTRGSRHATKSFDYFLHFFHCSLYKPNRKNAFISSECDRSSFAYQRNIRNAVACLGCAGTLTRQSPQMNHTSWLDTNRSWVVAVLIHSGSLNLASWLVRISFFVFPYLLCRPSSSHHQQQPFPPLRLLCYYATAISICRLYLFASGFANAIASARVLLIR